MEVVETFEHGQSRPCRCNLNIVISGHDFNIRKMLDYMKLTRSYLLTPC